jgi:hypothetical protein
LLLNPLALAVLQLRKGNHLPTWADSVAEWAADRPFAAVEWVVAVWVAGASMAAAEWAAAMAAAEAAIANVSEKLPFVARQGYLLELGRVIA